MANGFHGTKDEWVRIEAPLQQIDADFVDFSTRHSIPLSKNGKWPQRSFRWDDDLSRLIELYLDDERNLTYTLWTCATQDRDGSRYWRRQTLLKQKSIAEIGPVLPGLLEEALTLVRSWGQSDLEFATKLAKPR